METDVEIIAAQFRSQSSGIFLMIAEDFGRRVKKLNRRCDENVYQQLQSQYINELKKQLTHTAEKIISQYKGTVGLNVLRRELTGQIEYYISELLVKIKSM